MRSRSALTTRARRRRGPRRAAPGRRSAWRSSSSRRLDVTPDAATAPRARGPEHGADDAGLHLGRTARRAADDVGEHDEGGPAEQRARPAPAGGHADEGPHHRAARRGPRRRSGPRGQSRRGEEHRPTGGEATVEEHVLAQATRHVVAERDGVERRPAISASTRRRRGRAARRAPGRRRDRRPSRPARSGSCRAHPGR